LSYRGIGQTDGRTESRFAKCAHFVGAGCKTDGYANVWLIDANMIIVGKTAFSVAFRGAEGCTQ